MTYSVKEVFYTLQGEGANTGGPAVFCRFPGCNLWSRLGQQLVASSAIRILLKGTALLATSLGQQKRCQIASR